MAEYIFPAQVNYGWGLSLNMTGKAPAVTKRIFETYEDALAYVNDANDSAIAGLTLTVMNDTEDKNGVYFVAKVGSSVGANDGVLKQVGSQSQIDGSIEKEAAARKAVTGINADTYQKNASAKIIQNATSMNDADVKLDTALAALQTDFGSLTVYYDSGAKKVQLKKGAGVISEFDATAFVKDGMLDSVALEGDSIAFTFNTDAGKEKITVALTKFIDTAAKMQLTGYVISDKANEELALAPTDTVNIAFGKLEKAIVDNEEVCSKAFDVVKASVGLGTNLEYVKETSSNYLNEATSFKDADAKLDAAIKTVSDSIANLTVWDCGEY